MPRRSLPSCRHHAFWTSVALDISNLSGSAQKLDVKISAEGQLSIPGGDQLKQGQRVTLKVPVLAQGGLGQGKIKVLVEGLDLPGENLPAAYPAMLKHYRATLNDQTWSLPDGGAGGVRACGT